MNTYFPEVNKIEYAGQNASSQLAYRYYDPKRIVLGKTMAEQLKLAVCYWHTFCAKGYDAFGPETRNYAWDNADNKLKAAEQKLDAAIEFVTKLNVGYLTFHDTDLAPQGSNPKEYVANFKHMVDKLAYKMQEHKLKLLWGTANAFSHPRYMNGAATSNDPEVFAHAAFQVKHALDATKQLGGQGYVLWGGREGYNSTLNTDIKQELDQFGRFLTMVVEHKHKIGFSGGLYIEPKPCEPTKHQYDFDSATVYALLQKFGLEKEFQLNIEANHATLAGHSFADEIAYACANGILGSVDINRGDAQNGWDTDQFPNSVEELTLVIYEIMRNGGFKTGGFNFDAKIRRSSTNLEDLFYAHIGAIDVLAKSLLAAESLIHSKQLQQVVDARYKKWKSPLGESILRGNSSLEQLAQDVLTNNTDVHPGSEQQELCENIVNQHIWNSK